jgi:hypothetical protein
MKGALMDNNPGIIGRAVNIDIPDLALLGVPAKTDTGADLSSIWVDSVIEKQDGLHVVFFGPGSVFYDGKTHLIDRDYSVTRVANSFGQKQLRYKVKLRIRVQGRLIRATFTLSDRSIKTYPILLGRRLLKGKFLVDVTQGDALVAAEKQKKRQMMKDLKKRKQMEA